MVSSEQKISQNIYKRYKIDTSKEPDFNADFKYLSFIKLSLTHQKL
jgi:hypothetical protein